jgi:hypothetical protein
MDCGNIGNQPRRQLGKYKWKAENGKNHASFVRAVGIEREAHKKSEEPTGAGRVTKKSSGSATTHTRIYDRWQSSSLCTSSGAKSGAMQTLHSIFLFLSLMFSAFLSFGWIGKPQ